MSFSRILPRYATLRIKVVSSEKFKQMGPSKPYALDLNHTKGNHKSIQKQKQINKSITPQNSTPTPHNPQQKNPQQETTWDIPRQNPESILLSALQPYSPTLPPTQPDLA